MRFKDTYALAKKLEVPETVLAELQNSAKAMTKQEFLNNFAQKEKPKDTTSAMPFLMESIKEAKRNGIEFTKEEVYSMCTELSKNLPEKNRRQVEKLLKML